MKVISSGNLFIPGRTWYMGLHGNSAGGSQVPRDQEFGKLGPGNYWPG